MKGKWYYDKASGITHWRSGCRLHCFHFSVSIGKPILQSLCCTEPRIMLLDVQALRQTRLVWQLLHSGMELPCVVWLYCASQQRCHTQTDRRTIIGILRKSCLIASINREYGRLQCTFYVTTHVFLLRKCSFAWFHPIQARHKYNLKTPNLVISWED